MGSIVRNHPQLEHAFFRIINNVKAENVLNLFKDHERLKSLEVRFGGLDDALGALIAHDGRYKFLKNR